MISGPLREISYTAFPIPLKYIDVTLEKQVEDY